MALEFENTDQGVAGTLRNVANGLPPDHITIRGLLKQIGEQGMLFFCIILTIPFLTPIPLPGVSTVFGLLIMLIALGVILNRVPWLPRQLLERRVSSQQLAPVLNRGAQLFSRFERFIRPRWLALTHGATTNRLNGVILFIAGALLILPLPVIPLSNMLPGYAVLFLAVGMLQRDGLFVVLGYLLTIISAVYLGAWVAAAILAGQGISSLINESGAIFLWLMR
ncbi:MAG: exopolysaccharide biosynthesis protein [Anaerolineae bacterium]|nr:exopolysaccharide biosynthesis protein [Anaerolineae bacterium]